MGLSDSKALVDRRQLERLRTRVEHTIEIGAVFEIKLKHHRVTRGDKDELVLSVTHCYRIMQSCLGHRDDSIFGSQSPPPRHQHRKRSRETSGNTEGTPRSNSILDKSTARQCVRLAKQELQLCLNILLPFGNHKGAAADHERMMNHYKYGRDHRNRHRHRDLREKYIGYKWRSRSIDSARNHYYYDSKHRRSDSYDNNYRSRDLLIPYTDKIERMELVNHIKNLVECLRHTQHSIDVTLRDQAQADVPCCARFCSTRYIAVLRALVWLALVVSACCALLNPGDIAAICAVVLVVVLAVMESVEKAVVAQKPNLDDGNETTRRLSNKVTPR